MNTSINGRNLIKKHEGLRTTAYKCAAGKYTIGYGHTNGVYAGQRITKEQAEQLLSADIAACEKAVNIYVKRYNFNQNEYDSLVSFTFNLGAGNLNKLLNKGLRAKKNIADKMISYNKANGKVLTGLVRRRAEERTLFLTPVTQVTAMGVDWSKVFDAAYYASKYIDLKNAYGTDVNSLFAHFLAYGMKEHRQGNATFNVDVYIKNNPDVVQACTINGVLDITKCYEHYCIFGYKENRRAI